MEIELKFRSKLAYRCFLLFFLAAICGHKCDSQIHIANYVTNGSFEVLYDCNGSYLINNAIGWGCPCSDSSKVVGELHSQTCFSNAPNTGFGYQKPKEGDRFLRLTTYCTNPCSLMYSRNVPRNRLRAQLVQNQVYCVKLHMSLEDISPTAIADYGFCFVDGSIDSIINPSYPLTFLNPQVSNPVTNMLSDTMNWMTVSGTFTATGNEKYLVLGNFKSDAQTTTSVMIPSAQEDWAEYFIDAVSCIPVNLPAYAGPDKRCIVGDSVYLGRESDFAIDPYCQWYQLPNTTNTIAVNSGIWVKPTNTSTYVVRQELECGSVFWDTVVVYKDAVGNVELGMLNDELRVSPNPAVDEVVLSLAHGRLSDYFERIEILNTQGIVLKEILISNSEPCLEISVADLESGVYLLRLMDGAKEKVIVKKLAVQH